MWLCGGILRIEAPQYLYRTFRLMSGFMNVLCSDGNQVAEIHTGQANGWSTVAMASNIRLTIFY